MQQFLAKHSVFQTQQPPYFPDLAPCHFFLFKNQIPLKGTQISKCQGSPRECDEAATCYVKKVIPEMLPSVETRLDNVCGFRRELLRRRLNANMCCSFLFIAPVMILFDQSSYVYREETIIFEIFINSKKHDFYKFERRIYPESLVHHQEFKVLRGVCVFFSFTIFLLNKNNKYSKKIKNNL